MYLNFPRILLLFIYKIFNIMKKYIFLVVVCLLVLLTIPKVIAPKTVSAQNFISTNYILSDPVFGESGPYVSSPSFKERSALGQLVTGVSQSTNFILKSGFEYYSGQSVPSITMSLNTNLINFNTVAPNTIVKAPISTAGVQTTTALPTATSSATSVVYNGYVYEIGGCASTCPTSTVDYAPLNSNGTVGSWTATTPLPATTEQATSVVYNGYVYEIGGRPSSSSAPITTVDYAPIQSNGTLGAWTATTSLPTATYEATSVVYNGYVYEIGGAIVATVDYTPINSNGTLGAWTATTSLPSDTHEATSVVYNGYVYEIGGNFVATVDYAPIQSNGTLGAWTATTSLPAATEDATSVVYSGYVYEIGGCTTGSCPTATVDYASINTNGTLGSWTATTSLPVATAVATSVVYNGYVYEIGGSNSSGVSSTVYYFPIISATSIITVSSNAESGYNLYIAQNNNLTNQQGDTIPQVNNGATTTTAAPWTSASYYGLGYNCSASNTYKQAVLANSPIGFWTLGETSGTTAYDLSGNGNNGKYIGLQAFTATTALPAATQNATSVVYNGYVYEIGGDNGSVNVATVDYAPINSNGTLGSWTATTSLPQATNQATSVVYNGYMYEIGGNNGSVNVATVDYAPINSNGTLGSWTATTVLPTATEQATSVVYNGYVYEIGGYTTVAVATVDYAPINSNGTLGSWTATTSLPTGTYAATSVVYNGYVYEIGGNLVSTVDYAPINSNGTLGAWTATTSLPTATAYATSVVYNGYVYEIEGWNNGGVTTVDYALINSNGTLSNWTIIPANILWRSSSVVYNGYVYEIGGCASGACPTTTVNYVDTKQSGYTQGEPGPISNSNLGNSTLFNGFSSYISLPNVIQPYTTITISLWFRTTSDGVILGYQNNTVGSSQTNFVPIIYIGSDGKLRAELWNGGSGSITTTNTVNDGRWHNIILVGNSTTQSLYFDNSLIGTLSGTINNLNMTYDQIGVGETAGSWPDGNGGWFYFKGNISNVSIYNTALTSTQVQTLFNDGINSTQAICNSDFISSSYYRQLSSTNTEFASYSSIATNQEIAVGYAVNVSNIQASGIYTNNITYTLAGNY